MLYLCMVIQKDAASARATNKSLDPFGLKPYAVTSLNAALGLMAQWRFDVVLLDGHGFESALPRMLDELKESNVPIVLVMDELDEDHQVRLMERGATEVLTTPASMRSIGIRLRKLAEIRRERPPAASPTIRLGPLTLDTRRVSARIDSRELDLSGRQFDLLLLLVSKAGEFVHRETISTTLRSRTGMGSRSVDMLIVRIRQKLRSAGAEGLFVDTVYGRGYMLRFEAPAEVANDSPIEWCA